MMHRLIRLLFSILVLAAAALSSASPQLIIMQNKEFGVWNSSISGIASGVNPANFVVMTFIFVPGLGFYSKPTDAQPYLSLSPNGTFSGQLNTGGIDDYSTFVECYLVASNSSVLDDTVNGAADVPAAVKSAAVASDRSLCPGQRLIAWSGYNWYVKESGGAQVGPGPNIFSASPQDAWVDSSNNLHLEVTKNQQGQWVCPELWSMIRLGYGAYSFDVVSRLDKMDPALTLGMFSWNDFSSGDANTEIDIECSLWNNPANSWNTQYVVQPYTVTGNINRFVISSPTSTRQSFFWQPTRIGFASAEIPAFPITDWIYTGVSNPVSESERVHINLWLNNSAWGSDPGPNSGTPIEMILSNFTFTPWQDPVHPLYVWGNNKLADEAAMEKYIDYIFRFNGKITAKDTNGFTLLINEYGNFGPDVIRVLDPGNTLPLGEVVYAEGSIGSDKALHTWDGRVVPL